MYIAGHASLHTSVGQIIASLFLPKSHMLLHKSYSPKCPIKKSLWLWPSLLLFFFNFQPLTLSFSSSLLTLFHPVCHHQMVLLNKSFPDVPPLFKNPSPLTLAYDNGSQSVVFRESSTDVGRVWGPVTGALRYEMCSLNSNHSSPLHTDHLPLPQNNFTFVGLTFPIYFIYFYILHLIFHMKKYFYSVCVCAWTRT